jgi:hypothetical protein
VTEGLQITKGTETGIRASLPITNNKSSLEQSQVDPEELLSMVVVTDTTDDVVYIHLPPESDGGAMERYCESILFPTEGDAFLSDENFSKRQPSDDARSSSSTNIGCETGVMLPLCEEKGGEIRTDEVKDDQNMILIKGISTEQCSQGESEMEGEMNVITVPSADADEYLRFQHEMDASHGPEEPDGYQSLEDTVPKENTTAQQQQRYLVVFK